jgi:TonB family protein
MTRSASFFILSLALHATAMVYPVLFRGRGAIEKIQVTMLPIEEAGGAGAQGASGNPAWPRSDSKPNRTTPLPIEPRAGSKARSDPAPQSVPAEVAQVSDSVTLVSAIVNSLETNGTLVSGSTDDDSQNYRADDVGIGSGVDASATSGAGSGGGNGSGPGSAASAITLSQARYLDTPKPGYPEIARREGREGRVLLRVLVDDQGRARTVEINSSSGNEALDRAAAGAVKEWHFHPARYDDKAVESWLRIPIEFRLADTKSW